MQEKKNKRLFGLSLVLIACTAAVIWASRKADTPPVDRNTFRLVDYQTVDHVEMQSGENKVSLKFNGTRWVVNDAFDADRNMIKVLFATLQGTEPKRLVSASLQDSLKNRLKQNGVNVSLFSGQNRVQHFVAGGNESKTQAYFLQPDQDKVYVMNIPGYRVYVSGIFELTTNQWRDKYVFRLNWEMNFKSLRADFPDSPSESFTVARGRDDLFGIDGIEADTAKLFTFLDNVSLLTVDEYVASSTLADSLSNVRPLMIITVNDIGSKSYSLKIFKEKGSQVPGLLHENQPVILNRLMVRPILRPKSFFKAK
jgi:hypothetical protein